MKKNSKKEKAQKRGGCGAFVFGFALMVAFTKIAITLADIELRVPSFFVVFPSLLITGPLVLFFLITLLFPKFRGLASGLLVGALFFWSGWNIPWRLLIPKQKENPISIASWNVYMGALGPNGLLEEIKKEKTDIWCFQEMTKWKKNPGLNLNKVKEIVGGEKFVLQGGESAFVSSLPVLAQKMEPLGGSSRRIIGIKVMQGKDPLWVVCMHYHFSSVGERRMTNRVLRMMSSQKHFISPLKSQTQHIDNFLQELDAPAVVLGDFNSNPLMPPYHYYKKTHTDSFLAAGWGFGYTFHRKTPLIRIDYIWVPKKTHQVLGFKRIWSPYSDHALIRTEIARRH